MGLIVMTAALAAPPEPFRMRHRSCDSQRLAEAIQSSRTPLAGHCDGVATPLLARPRPLRCPQRSTQASAAMPHGNFQATAMLKLSSQRDSRVWGLLTAAS